ncbi:MAG: glycosyltransferase family 4 protein [Candidatus Omnitrophota bacterium]|nr:glycosyltransferase family 4 protein [Candidatus Omnitrophota bacterium]
MNILFANKYSVKTGGVEYYINALAVRLQDEGHKIGIVHWDEVREGARAGFSEHYRITALWNNELIMTGKTRDRLNAVLREFSPDIAYLHNVENAKVIDYFATQVPTVRYIHGYKTVDPDGKMLLCNPVEANSYPLSPACFVRAYTRGVMPRNPVKGIKAYLRAKSVLEATKRLEKIIVATGHMKETLINNGIEPGRISVLPYFVDYRQQQAGETPDRRRILFTGRIAEGKGLVLLFDVLKLVEKDYILDVVGTGPMEKISWEKAKSLGIAGQVRFHGWVGHEHLPEYYRRASFLVVPSVWPEPFGICGIEAAFFGRSAVAFNVGGISDWLIDGETGFLIEPYNKEKMADRIDCFLGDPEKAIEFGRKARKLAEKKYAPDLHIEKLLKIFGK